MDDYGIITDAKCGYCVQAGDAEKLAETILTMKMDTEKTKSMGINARIYAIENVSKNKAVEKYIEVIEALR